MTLVPGTEPKPSRVLTVGLVIVFVAGLNTATTQYIASQFAYHPALGAPLAGHVYPPWEWLIWKAQFGEAYPRIFRLTSAGVLFTTAVALLGLVFSGAAGGRRAQRYEGVHGTAHWASRAEIDATGLLPRKGQPGKGVYVGGWRDDKRQLHYLRHNGPEHVAAIAPTRSGKGVGLVVPTLLSWPH